MKAIRQISKAEKDRINQLARQNVADWLKKNEQALTRRVLKIVCVSLNEEFGFGAERLSRLVNDLMDMNKFHLSLLKQLIMKKNMLNYGLNYYMVEKFQQQLKTY